jgi:uncharacterized protein YhaN
MITGSMARFPPPPDTGPKPVMWKSLGIVAQNMTGWVEMHYELETFHGDLDPDSEDEVRGSAHGLLAALTSMGRVIDPDAVYTLQRRRGLLKVKLVGGLWNDEPNTVMGRM